MDVYNNIIESKVNNNEPEIKEKRLKLILLTLPSNNLFENVIKLYCIIYINASLAKSERNERNTMKSFISYNIQINNKSTIKDYLYATILIHLFEKTENNNILKNFKNFFIYFENINVNFA